MLTKETQLCGCSDPNCRLPVEEEKDYEIIEDVEQDFPKIAKNCKTQEGEYST